jgi:hypothetical protein
MYECSANVGRSRMFRLKTGDIIAIEIFLYVPIDAINDDNLSLLQKILENKERNWK